MGTGMTYTTETKGAGTMKEIKITVTEEELQMLINACSARAIRFAQKAREEEDKTMKEIDKNVRDNYENLKYKLHCLQ